MKIYTKTGDKGETGLIGGTRVSKDNFRLEAYGTVDELNSYIGLLCSYNLEELSLQFLEKTQNNLFLIGSYLATDQDKTSAEKFLIKEHEILQIENEIDRLNEQLPELTSFILPGGNQAASISHICRTISRRAERKIISLNNSYNIDIQIIKYTNRLSDYFFTLARFINLLDGQTEKSWKL